MDDLIDLLVIGGGTAGIVGAKTAARLGARTVLVEQHRTGGDCLWTGCVPSKTILSAAAHASLVREAADTEPDFTQVRKRIRATISTIEPDDSAETLEAAGVTVLHGIARFTAPGVAQISGVSGGAGERIRFRQALIVTGSFPSVPEIPGLKDAGHVTSDTIWELTQLPPRLVVIGGGPIACELGQAFARLGSDVTVLARSGLLPKEDPDAAALVQASLERDGATVLVNEEPARVHRRSDEAEGADGADGAGRHMVTTSAGRRLQADVVLVATGRTPRSAGLGLEQLGVECDEAGHVLVDDTMRTSNRSIWAAGDVTPHPKFTHLAAVHASTAASNAVLGLRRRVSRTVPRITYTSPEVAAVGLTAVSGPGMTTSTVSLEHTDRALTEDSSEGFARLVIGRRGRILGGTLVGPRAGESLGELTLAVAQKLSTRQLAGITHAYPTYNDALWDAAIAHARDGLDSPVVNTATSALAALVRRRRRGPESQPSAR
ncbi:FAD-dependent oxidoreductase [Nesterenkonia sp. LB17]|uniref:dihydrolipoyl dehydrogenase family protein n=1 Tax=Nesterenkonia sp. LB17 TaxID=2901230 RepID=UPI001F4C8915|nr:FAD-dependent oxidoreductase [Nesterenkonia sp. LB17]